MQITRDGQAPYAPVDAIMTVIDGYRHKHPSTPFTVENIQPLGVATSIAPRTLQALRLLDLVDDQGAPTATMDALREVSNGEFPARLAEVVRATYAEVFNYKDPAQDSPEEMVEIFRFYKPQSMQPRMIRLFYGLCAQAQIIEAAPAIAAGGKSSSRKAPGAKARAATATSPSPSTPPFKVAAADTSTVPQTTKRLPDIIKALVDELPAEGESMTAEDFDWFIDMMLRAAPKVYNFTATERGRS